MIASTFDIDKPTVVQPDVFKSQQYLNLNAAPNH